MFPGSFFITLAPTRTGKRVSTRKTIYSGYSPDHPRVSHTKGGRGAWGGRCAAVPPGQAIPAGVTCCKRGPGAGKTGGSAGMDAAEIAALPNEPGGEARSARGS